MSVEVKLGDARDALDSLGSEDSGDSDGDLLASAARAEIAASLGSAAVSASASAATSAAATPQAASEVAAAATAAAATAACDALEERLCRYSTTLEEDLAMLQRCSIEEKRDQGREKASSPSPATTEWVEMCVSVRAAEKIALRRALRENSPRPAS